MMSRSVCICLKSNREIPIPKSTVLALGNFDGVHLAHRLLIEQAVALRDQKFPEAKCGVFCFTADSVDAMSPHPQPHLCTQDEKLERFAACGADFVLLADFASMREFSPEMFVREILQAEYRCVAAVCGFNYRFGKAAAGNAELLKSLMNGSAMIQEPVTVDGEPVSSTRIRRLLAEGQAEQAARLLTEPYSIYTEVLHGKKLGRSLGFPTINQPFPKGSVLPRYGVYLTDCEVEGRHYRGVSNVGVHPTVDAPDRVSPNCETFLLDFSGDLYGKRVRTAFLRFLRAEQTFASVEELREQIERDIRNVNGR